jgi:feruloyl esterase
MATAGLYKQLVYLHELGGKPLTDAQQDMVSIAAIRACDSVGGVHLGYIIDNASCRYDPTRDAEVLCTGDGGRNSTPACVNKVQAAALNRIWYGATADGSVPDPAVDNGYRATLADKQLWFGFPRGTLLSGSWYVRNLMRSLPPGTAAPASPVNADMIALALQNPTISNAQFKNATGDGQDMWREMSYRQLANAMDRVIALQPLFANINTDDPDLSRFKARGGKFVGWHGTNDEVIPVQGTLNYYHRLAERMGGAANVNGFYRMYLVPGAGHGGPLGAANGDANPPAVVDHMYAALRDWVEKGIAPGRMEITSAKPGPTAATHPLCPLPQKIVYKRGSPLVASSFACE